MSADASTFYLVCAGASATLVGLLFVAVQIGPPLVTAGRLGPRHAIARSTFTVFVIVMMLSLLFLVPGLDVAVRADWTLAAAAAGIFRAARTWFPVWREGRMRLKLWQTVWLLVGPVLAYGYLAVAGAELLRSGRPDRFDVDAAFVFVVLFVIGLRNSWNLLVEARASG